MKKGLLAVIIAAIVGLKFYFSLKYFHIDIWSNAGWGQWIAENGTKEFFYNNVWVYSWPTQLPLVNLMYGWSFDLGRYLIIGLIRIQNLMVNLRFDGDVIAIYGNFLNFMNSSITPEIPFKHWFIFAIKLLAMVADLVIAVVIWQISRSQFSDASSQENRGRKSKAWVWAIIYLISPFSWYTSAFWGQYDAISFLFLLLSILTVKKWRILSPLLMSISLGVKPTSAIFIPFYLYLLWEERKYWKSYVLGGILGLGLNLYWVGLFSQEENLLKFIRGRLWTMVLGKSEPRVTVNSYNFWHLFLGDKAANPSEWF